MPAHPHTVESPRWALLFFILAVTGARLIYLAFFCPYTLAEDEAWYWEWSRHLEWSYYSKGPGVAWIIAASVALFRQFGVQVSEFVVRFPAVISGAVMMIAVAGLARDTLRDRRSTILAVVALLLAPAFFLTPFLMTIDIPYMACWGLAAWAGWRALRSESRWAWPALGAAIGAGFLFKYTIVLLIPGLLLFAVIARPHLRLASNWQRWLAAGTALFVVGLLPVIIWNARHDWPTVQHLMGHLGLVGGDVAPRHGAGRGWVYNPIWTLEFLAAQIGFIGPLIALMVSGVIAAVRSRRDAGHPDRIYLILCALPILLFYALITLATPAQANWPIAGYITLFPIVAWVVVSARDGAAAGLQRSGQPQRMLWRASIIYGGLIILLSLRLDLIAASRPIQSIDRIAGEWGLVAPGRPLIPIGRLTGADVMARNVDRLTRDLAAESGREPFIVAQHYGRASLLAFYTDGQPTVYCASAYGGGRRTQYDLWSQTSLGDPGLRGRPAVLVGSARDQWERAFDQVREHGPLDGETKAGRLTFLGIGFRGFDARPGDLTEDKP